MTCGRVIVSIRVMSVLQDIMDEVHNRALPDQDQI